MDNNFWSPKQLEELKEGEEKFTEVMQKALNNESSQFEFLRCLEDYFATKQYIRGVDLVINIFNNILKNTSKIYQQQIETNTQDLGIILALKQFLQCRDFYAKEREMAYDMIAEYKAYVFGGHFWDTLVGNIRKDEDLVDYRKLPTRWF